MSLPEAIAALDGLASRVPTVPGTVELVLNGPIARLTLRNAGARNALTMRMMAELGQAVDHLTRWNGAALVISGEGSAFCAGGHLDQVMVAIAARPMHRSCAGP